MTSLYTRNAPSDPWLNHPRDDYDDNDDRATRRKDFGTLCNEDCRYVRRVFDVGQHGDRYTNDRHVDKWESALIRERVSRERICGHVFDFLRDYGFFGVFDAETMENVN